MVVCAAFDNETGVDEGGGVMHFRPLQMVMTDAIGSPMNVFCTVVPINCVPLAPH